MDDSKPSSRPRGTGGNVRMPFFGSHTFLLRNGGRLIEKSDGMPPVSVYCRKRNGHPARTTYRWGLEQQGAFRKVNLWKLLEGGRCNGQGTCVSHCRVAGRGGRFLANVSFLSLRGGGIRLLPRLALHPLGDSRVRARRRGGGHVFPSFLPLRVPVVFRCLAGSGSVPV